MEVWQLILLAIVQGVTEFLPVSSSGHLVALHTFWGLEGEGFAVLNVALHVGTLLAICIVYFDRLWSLLSTDHHLVWPLVVGTIPAGAIGLLVGLLGWEEALHRGEIAGAMLVVTGAVLWLGREAGQSIREPVGKGGPGCDQVSRVGWRSALVIGFAQAIAILPGASRSGFTIVAGRRAGLSSELAARFSFLLAIPVIGGAGIVTICRGILDSGGVMLSLRDLLGVGFTDNWRLMILGMVISAVVGIISLRLLLVLLERGKFHWFSIWCIPLGCILLIYTVSG